MCKYIINGIHSNYTFWEMTETSLFLTDPVQAMLKYITKIQYFTASLPFPWQTNTY